MTAWIRDLVRKYAGVKASLDLKLWFNLLLIKLLWLGLLGLGGWKIVTGLYEGPNYYALRYVEVEDVSGMSSFNALGREEYSDPRIYYSYQDQFGNGVRGTYRARSEETRYKAKHAHAAERIQLLVPVSDGSWDAGFRINQEVREGIFLIVTMLMLWGHFQFREDPLDRWPIIQLFVGWQIVLWPFLWLTAI